MINILITTALLYVVLIAGYRTLFLAGAPFSLHTKHGRGFFHFEDATHGISPTCKQYLRIAALALCLRFGIYLFSAFAICFFSESGTSFRFDTFLDHWYQWDASNYIRIATGGYRYHLENGEPTTLVFFPLYSILIRGCFVIIRDYRISAMIVSTLCYIGGVCYLFGFVSEEYGTSVGAKTVLYLSIFPFSFFFGGMMPESCFLLTSCAFFYYMRRHRWGMVALFGYLSALSRIQGILLLIPAGIEWLLHYQPIGMLVKRKYKEFTRSLLILLPICSGLLGLITYLMINNQVAGNPFKFLELQESVWHHHYEYVGKAITTIFHYAFGGRYDAKMVAVLWIPQAAIATLALALLVYAANKHKPQEIFYLAAYTIVSFSASFILSGGRYMSVAIPMFLILAKWFDSKPRLHLAWVILSSMLLALYTAGYVLGYQIM